MALPGAAQTKWQPDWWVDRFGKFRTFFTNMASPAGTQTPSSLLTFMVLLCEQGWSNKASSKPILHNHGQNTTLCLTHKTCLSFIIRPFASSVAWAPPFPSYSVSTPCCLPQGPSAGDVKVSSVAASRGPPLEPRVPRLGLARPLSPHQSMRDLRKG
jgi:hypothetical protein